MGFGLRALMAGGAGLAAAFLVACGGNGGGTDKGFLSGAESSTISGELSAISSAVNAGQCARAREATDNLNDTLANLPAEVNQKLAHNLGEGASTVKTLALRDCQASGTSTTSSTSSTTQSTSTSATSSVPATSSTPSTPATNPVTQTNPATQSTPHSSTTPSSGGGSTNGGAGLNAGGGGGQ
jgi:hypothetical protein